VDGVEQRGDVGKAAEHLRAAPDEGVIHCIDDAVAARAAGQRQDAVHAGVGEGRVHGRRALGVAAGEVAVAGAQLRRRLHLEGVPRCGRPDEQLHQRHLDARKFIPPGTGQTNT